MALFESLAPETISAIFEYLSPQSALNLALTKRVFYAGGKLAANRSKIISLAQSDAYEQLQEWLDNGEVLRNMRVLEVGKVSDTRPSNTNDETASDNGSDSSTASTDSDDDLSLNPQHVRSDGSPVATHDDIEGALVALIETLSNLKVLKWTAGVLPLCVIEALHEHQKSAELQIYGFEREDATADENVPAEKALASSPALTALSVKLSENYHHNPDLRLACIQRIIANAPKLRFASVVDRHTDSWADRSMRPPTLQQELLLQQMADKFLTHDQPNTSLRRLTLDGVRMRADKLESWSRCIDLSQLQEIKLSRGKMDAGTFKYMQRTLTNLKRLSLNLRQADAATIAAAETYLANCPPLEFLSIWSGKNKVALDVVLGTHGSKLVHLDLREPEHNREFERRTFFDAKQCKAIRQACPKLRDFTIDRYRHSQSLEDEIDQDEALTELAWMDLSRLQMYYDLDSMVPQIPLASDSDGLNANDSTYNGPDADCPAPSLDHHIEPFLRKLWALNFTSANPTSPRVLEVKFGEWDIDSWRRRRHFSPAYARDPPGKSRWIVRPHENVDMDDLVIIKDSRSSEGLGDLVATMSLPNAAQ